jgi:3-mercaptopyruvate sulfurtransferase SseA
MRLLYALSVIMLSFALAACSAGNRTTNTTNQTANTNNATANTNAGTTTAGSPATAQNTPPVPHPEARRISVAELQAAVARNEAVVVDVRTASDFEEGHIRGALHIPAGEVTSRASELPRDKMIVTYCS